MAALSFFAGKKGRGKRAMQVRADASPLAPAELIALRELLHLVRAGEVLPRDLDAGAVAKALGLERRAVLNKARSGEFPGAWKPAPNRLLIPVAAVLAYREKRKIEPAGGSPA